MLLTTLETLPGRDFDILGIAQGGMVQSKHMGKDIMAGLKTMVGGELKGYTEMMQEARNSATARMIQEAVGMGADAVICVRYSSSAIMQGAAEVMAYGTAIKFK